MSAGDEEWAELVAWEKRLGVGKRKLVSASSAELVAYAAELKKYEAALVDFATRYPSRCAG